MNKIKNERINWMRVQQLRCCCVLACLLRFDRWWHCRLPRVSSCPPLPSQDYSPIYLFRNYDNYATRVRGALCGTPPFLIIFGSKCLLKCVVPFARIRLTLGQPPFCTSPGSQGHTAGGQAAAALRSYGTFGGIR